MARYRPSNILLAWSPELIGAAASALETDGLASAITEMGIGTMTVYVTFENDNSTYEYPNVPSIIALQVIADPNGEGVFEQIRYWPGYRRIA
jgi:hypothetical protein